MTLAAIDAVATTPAHVTVLTDRCAGCQECVIRCPAGALALDSGRWVAVPDDALCVGCRQCERTCPFSAITVKGSLAVAERSDPQPHYDSPLAGDTREIRPGFSSWDEALAEAARCLDCPDPTCVRGCPAHNDIPSFIRAIRARDLGSAHETLRRTSVMPDICSRVCDHGAQCEGACTWSLAGGAPVAIGRLERFITEHTPVPPPTPAQATGAGLSVAVIGSGPAGIGAAWHLAEQGASVTVYEREAEPGGLLGWGIPGFTLPGEVAVRPWRQLTEAGVDLRCGADVRPADIGGLLTEHDALILAHGAPAPLLLHVPGAGLDGVTDATRFLRGAKAALAPTGNPAAFRASLGLPDDACAPGKPAPMALVLGAGNTAMDVARTALRLGLQATCVDWLDERFALTRPDELDEARREGVAVRFSRTVTRLDGDGRVARAVLAVTTQTRANRRPKVHKTAPEVLDVDLVVMALGYQADPDFAPILPGTPVRRQASGLADRRWTASGIFATSPHHRPVGFLALGREAGLQAAALPFQERVWAAGDALVGPSTVVEAMAQGRHAAASLLAARPTRPGRPRPSGPRQVLVGYESRRGRTAGAAKAIAIAFFANGDNVQVLPIARIGLRELAAADLVVVGSWVEGAVTGARPAKAMRTWLASLPRLGGKPAAVFCTFTVAPRETLPAMRQALQAKGAVVVTQAAFGPRELGPGAGVFSPAAFGAELVLRTARQ